MPINRFISSGPATRSALCAVTLAALFWGFFADGWRVAEPGWFAWHQHDTEGLVVGRMVKSRQDGILSAGGLNGAGMENELHEKWISWRQVRHQYESYFNGLTFSEYRPYMSQNGGQGMFFSVLDRLIPLSPRAKLDLFYALTSLLTAAALAAIVLWFAREFGLWAAVFAASSMVLSQWLTLFGRNLWWSLYMFYLPMIALTEYFRRRPIHDHHASAALAVLVFALVFAKCFANGFEYITTALVMMATPFVYYSVRDGLPASQFIKGAIVVACSAGLAVASSLVLLLFQIAAVKGSLLNGIQHIAWSLGRRTYGASSQYAAEYADSLKAGTFEVVSRYVTGPFLDLNNYVSTDSAFISDVVLKIRYLHLIALFLLASVFLYVRRNDAGNERGKHTALIAATWFSMLAPLSWFVIFKAHSAVHTHMNFIAWQMPFVFFGCALCGLAVRTAMRTSRLPAGAPPAVS